MAGGRGLKYTKEARERERETRPLFLVASYTCRELAWGNAHGGEGEGVGATGSAGRRGKSGGETAGGSGVVRAVV